MRGETSKCESPRTDATLTKENYEVVDANEFKSTKEGNLDVGSISSGGDDDDVQGDEESSSSQPLAFFNILGSIDGIRDELFYQPTLSTSSFPSNGDNNSNLFQEEDQN
eukprot:5403842-Ditylum_brightwellii.AAC.1